MKLFSTTSVLALCLGAATAQAQDTFDLGVITVSASQTPVETKRTGATVEIVTEDEIAQSPERRVSEVLDTLPGVSIAGNGGLGSVSKVQLRGLSSQYVPIYIDGIDMTDPSSTQTFYDFGALTTAGIGRIEVLKGSQSAIYGSEAIGGVVNVTTYRPTRDGMQGFVTVEAGSYNTYAATLGVATRAERGEIALTLSHVRSDGFSAADENNGNAEADGFKGTTLILTGAYQATDTVRLGFAINHIDSEADADGFPAPAFVLADTADREFTTRTGARVYAEIDGAAVDHTLSLSFTDTERFYPTGFTNNFSGERTEVEYQGVTQIGAAQLAFGASYSEETFDADAVTGTYEIASIFGEVQYAVSDDLDISFALRHDDHSTFGGFTTGRLAASWQLNADTTVRASVGTGFRAPSLYELFGPFGTATLEQEESRSAEIGIEHGYASGAAVKATAFYTEIDNLILFDTTTFTYQQAPGTSRTRGLELSGQVPISAGADVFASYTYTDAEDSAGNQIIRVPTHDFVLGVEADLTPALSGQIVLNHIAGRANDAGQVMDDYTVVNASMSYEFTDNAQAYVRIENLTNREYQTSAGYGTSDRAVFFGVRANF